jgi:hypothetical protein
MNRILLVLVGFLLLVAGAAAVTGYDDFEDASIVDWNMTRKYSNATDFDYGVLDALGSLRFLGVLA